MAETAGVIVTYDRPDMLRRSLESVLGQSVPPGTVFVIDNSPGDGTRKMIEKEFPGVEYRHFPENIGSEAGFREGIALASEGHDSVWLMDDDCVAEKEALAELLKWGAELGKRYKVGAVRSARAWDRPGGEPVRKIGDIFAWRGTLLSSEAVKEVGLPEKDLFLYAGDVEYGLRMRKAGYSLFLVYSSRIESLELSRKDRGRFIVRTEMYGQPYRVYYAYRNELWVNGKYRRHAKTFRLILRGMLNVLFSFFRGKPELSRAVIDGVRDGSRGRLGKNGRYLP